ncbi:MAG: hypothetical protein ABFR47_07760 [Verrucomicrobiota bacterium]
MRRVCVALCLMLMCSASVQAVQLPLAKEMSVVVPVSRKASSVSLPVVNSYPDGLAVEKNIRVEMGCDGKNLTLDYAIPYREGYKFRPSTKRDGPLWREDAVEIFVGSPNNKKLYQFIVNPAGTIRDAHPKIGAGWTSSLKVDSEVGIKVWSLNVSIPLSDIGVDSLNGDLELAFNTAVRSADAKNRYILGLFPFLPKQFSQPANFGRIVLSSDRLFVSRFERSSEVKDGNGRVFMNLEVKNPSEDMLKFEADGTSYEVAAGQQEHVKLSSAAVEEWLMLQIQDLAGFTFAMNMRNPFFPDIEFVRSGADKILVQVAGRDELFSICDELEIEVEGASPVRFKKIDLDDAFIHSEGLLPGDRMLTIRLIKNDAVITQVATEVRVIDETPIDFDLSELDVSKYYKPMQVDLPVVKSALSEIRLAKDSVFPESIKVKDTELLIGTVRLSVNGQTASTQESLKKVGQHKNRVSFEGTFALGNATVTQDAFIDYDGLIWSENRVGFSSSVGKTVTMTIPLTLDGDVFVSHDRLIRTWQLTPDGFRTEGTFKKGYLSWVEPLKEGSPVVLPLTSGLTVANDFRGLAIHLPTEPRKLNLESYDQYVTVVRKGDQIDVVIALSDGKKELSDGELDFSLGLQPVPSRDYNNRANFDYRIYKGGRYGFDLVSHSSKIDRTDENAAIIAFQCWSEYQNYYTTYQNAERMTKLGYMFEQKNKKLLTYSGFEISDACPEARLYLRTVASGEAGGYIRESVPQQCWAVCYGSQWGDYLLRRIKEHVPEFGRDGYFMDGTLGVIPCANPRHGHGGKDAYGRIVPDFTTLDIRRFSQLLHHYTRGYKEDFLQFLHTSRTFNPASMGLVDVILNGEQTKPIMGTWKIPLDAYRGQFNGRVGGVPQQILTYSARTTYRRDFAASLLFDAVLTPWTVSANPEVKFVEDLWTLFDEFDLDGKYFVPFYSPDAEITDTTGNTLVSYYDTPERLVIVVSNYEGTKDVAVKIDLGRFAGKTKDMATEVFDRTLFPIRDGTFELPVGKEDFRLIRIGKR